MALPTLEVWLRLNWLAIALLRRSQLRLVLGGTAVLLAATAIVLAVLPAGHDALLVVHVEVEGRLFGPQALTVFSWRMLEYNVCSAGGNGGATKSSSRPWAIAWGL